MPLSSLQHDRDLEGYSSLHRSSHANLPRPSFLATTTRLRTKILHRPPSWNLVTNEILSESWQPGGHIHAFADDFVFVISESTGEKLKSTAHKALAIFKRWKDKCKHSVSIEKSCDILISNRVSGPSIKWVDKVIKRTTSLKYLYVTIDKKLNWADHLCNLKTKITHLHQNIRKIAGTNWGLNKAYRRRLYITVAERIVLQGEAAWAYPLSARQERQLNSHQRKFLLNISRAYSTNHTAALQVIGGLLPLH
ncbi:hypothetical protein AVEN_177444-1 [Araneus ventricosus]|uniref:Reverse transcriptase domain-containing protein n=1 Tax=Araneus ventricosus TaxID=182803 RepID=A0A4Y2LAV9_ARAVE|nr:hypothetical protein AVEN_177444-1 [Araneus ventricosus]